MLEKRNFLESVKFKVTLFKIALVLHFHVVVIKIRIFLLHYVV